MGFEKEIYPGGNQDKIRGKLERELDTMPDGVKNFYSNIYGLVSVAFKKEKGGGFLNNFLKSKEACKKAMTQMDDALVERKFLDICREYEDTIESTADQSEKEKLKKEYHEFKGSREKKFSREKQDRKLNGDMGNAWKDLFRSFGK